MTRGMLVLALVGAACTGGGPPPGEASVEMGTGETAFEPLDDEQEVELIAGPQGGHHVWISFRASGLSSNRVLLDLDVEPLDATEPQPERSPVRTIMSPINDDERELIGWPAVLPSFCWAGRRILVSATLTDSSGQTCSDERIVIPTAPQEWLESCE